MPGIEEELLKPGPPPDPFTRLLWRCAGADVELLQKCPNSDRVKYQGLGGIVLATSVLAFCSSTYAFYTVFSPKEGSALERATDWPSVGLSMFAGLLWALVIFNLDRFIVSSTGKGDGTEKITWSELVNALPRIVMGTIIGISLAAPLEIRVLKGEIDAALSHRVNEERDRLNAERQKEFDAQRKDIGERKNELKKERDAWIERDEQRRLEKETLNHDLELEAQGRSASGKSGEGPAYRTQRDHLGELKRTYEREHPERLAKIEALDKEMVGQDSKFAAVVTAEASRHAENDRAAEKLDGLLERIKLADKLGHEVVWFIRLLLLAIELAPIFFKLMMTKGVYDALSENKALLIKAHYGIESDAELFRDKKNREEHRDIFHGAAGLLEEEKRRLASESALAQKAHEEFVKKKSAEIEKDPTRFVSND